MCFVNFETVYLYVDTFVRIIAKIDTIFSYVQHKKPFIARMAVKAVILIFTLNLFGIYIYMRWLEISFSEWMAMQSLAVIKCIYVYKYRGQVLKREVTAVECFTRRERA